MTPHRRVRPAALYRGIAPAWKTGGLPFRNRCSCDCPLLFGARVSPTASGSGSSGDANTLIHLTKKRVLSPKMGTMLHQQIAFGSGSSSVVVALVVLSIASILVGFFTENERTARSISAIVFLVAGIHLYRLGDTVVSVLLFISASAVVWSIVSGELRQSEPL